MLLKSILAISFVTITTYFNLLIITITTTVAEDIAPCQDNSTFTWKYEWSGQNYTLDCAFLTNSAITNINTRRQNRHCRRVVRKSGKKVQNFCPVSCKFCNRYFGCHNFEKFQDRDEHGCKWYRREAEVDRCEEFGDKRANENGDTANVACCVCGGGCKDDEEWHEAGGEQFDCAWYSTNPERKCLYFGHRNANKGKTANDACCLCKRLFRQRQKANNEY